MACIEGTRLTRLPREFDRCSRLLVTSWGHDPSEIPLGGALTMILDALQHSAVLVQAVAVRGDAPDEREDTGNMDGLNTHARTKSVPFPRGFEDFFDPPCRPKT